MYMCRVIFMTCLSIYNSLCVSRPWISLRYLWVICKFVFSFKDIKYALKAKTVLYSFKKKIDVDEILKRSSALLVYMYFLTLSILDLILLTSFCPRS